MSGSPPLPPLPQSSFPPTPPLPQPSSSAVSAVSSAAASPASSGARPLTLDSLAEVVAEMSANMAVMNRSIAAMQAAWTGLTQQHPPPASLPPPPQPTLPAPAAAPTDHSAGVPPVSLPVLPSTGLPLHMLLWPPSPSPIPSWAMAGSAAAPIYTMATSTSTAPPPHAFAGGDVSLPLTPGVFYGDAAGNLYYRGAPSSAALPSGNDAAVAIAMEGGAPAAAAVQGAHAPPRFYKLEFPTFDGSADPLNWLNHCDQFFRGQRTLDSDRTWLASYHLRGDAQTWYYALEQDEGMPAWDRFRALCQLRFGPPTQGTRLAQLARLPFTSSVQEYSNRYNAILCHARDLNPRQKAELYVGGLPEHIQVDVELQHPPDLQTAMYLARAFERRAAAFMPAQPPQQRGGRTPPRPSMAAPATGGAPATQPPALSPAATGQRRFRRLTTAEQLERRRQGLSFNCDEQYARGHVCKRLFYLETVDEYATVEDKGLCHRRIRLLRQRSLQLMPLLSRCMLSQAFERKTQCSCLCR